MPPRYAKFVERRGRLFWVAEVVDSHDAGLIVRGPKRFLFERRAVRWASDERHTLEREAWSARIARKLEDVAA